MAIVVVVILASAREWYQIAARKKTPKVNEAPFVEIEVAGVTSMTSRDCVTNTAARGTEARDGYSDGSFTIDAPSWRLRLELPLSHESLLRRPLRSPGLAGSDAA